MVATNEIDWLKKCKDLGKLPQHISIIMDGNGRWAHQRFKPRVFGHKAGAESVRSVVEVSGEIGIKYLSLYAFSEENWGRPKDEVHAIFSLLDRYIKQECDSLDQNNVKFIAIGCRDHWPAKTRKLIEQAEKRLEGNTGLNLIVAVSYGSRQELAEAMRKLAGRIQSGELKADELNESHIQSCLYTSDIPSPDLLIRTSGEQRISNFLLWQLAYAELYFTEKCWPDFKKEELLAAIDWFQQRNRRFGLTDQQLSSRVEVGVGANI